jgi:hypothetical protein
VRRRARAAYDDWSAKLDEVVDTVEEDGFEACSDNVKEVVEYALGTVRRSTRRSSTAWWRWWTRSPRPWTR